MAIGSFPSRLSSPRGSDLTTSFPTRLDTLPVEQGSWRELKGPCGQRLELTLKRARSRWTRKSSTACRASHFPSRRLFAGPLLCADGLDCHCSSGCRSAGQSRLADTPPAVAECPLRPESDRRRSKCDPSLRAANHPQ